MKKELSGKKTSNRILQAGVQFFLKFRNDEVPALGAQTSYYLLVALFPFLSLLVNITSNNPDIIQAVLRFFNFMLPSETYLVVEEVVRQTVGASTTTMFSLSMLATVLAAMRGMIAIIRVLNKAYNVEETRGIVAVWSLAFFAMLLMVFMIAFSLAVLVFGEVLGRLIFSTLGLSSLFARLWGALRYGLAILLLTFVLAMMYRFLPNHRLTWRSVLPGAFFAALGWIIVALGFSYYINNFTNYSLTYGSIGGIFVLLLWLYLSSTIILCGGEINALLAGEKALTTH